MKINLNSLLNTVAKYAVPIATTIVVHKVLNGGKIDLGGAIRDEVRDQLGQRAQ